MRGCLTVLALLASGCLFHKTNQADGAACGGDDECKSGRCTGGFCAGAQCLCGGKLCQRDQEVQSADCAAGWICYGPSSSIFDPVSDFFDPYQPQKGRCRETCVETATCPSSYGCAAGVCQYPAPPTVTAGGPYAAPLGAPVQFHALGMSKQSSIVSYYWSFGDGQSATIAAPVYTYATAGLFTAIVSANDKNGRSATGQAMVAICSPTGATCSPGDPGSLCCGVCSPDDGGSQSHCQ